MWKARNPVAQFIVRALNESSKSLKSPPFSFGERVAEAPFDRIIAPSGAVTTLPSIVQLPDFCGAANEAVAHSHMHIVKIAEIENFFIPKIKFLRVKNRKTILYFARGNLCGSPFRRLILCRFIANAPAILHADWVSQFLWQSAARHRYFFTFLDFTAQFGAVPLLEEFCAKIFKVWAHKLGLQIKNFYKRLSCQSHAL